MSKRVTRFRAAAAASLLLLTLGATGCYRAVVETGRPPSGQQINIPWAHSFIAGLIPPSTVNAAAECPAGVARVVTEHTVLNMLVQLITFSLYSPMSITVDCAAPGAAMLPAGDPTAQVISVPAGSSLEELGKAFNDAARQSSDLRQPVYVDFSALK
jgi:hypothetical protein